jgi:acetyl esterase
MVAARSPGLGQKMFDPVEARRIAHGNLVPTPPNERLETADLRLPSLNRLVDIPARLYRPVDRPAKLPVIVYFHGGGWVLGDLDTHDALCGRLALQVNVIVLAVDYRLAPEAAYPAALDDALSAVVWAVEHCDPIHGRADFVGVAGDSSGGNVAAAVALLARDRGGPTIGAQILIYPPLDARCESPSYADQELSTEGGTITLDQMRWFWDQYIDKGDPDNPLISPMRAELEGLPPTLIVVAGFDPLSDDGRMYAQRLDAAGVPVRLEEYPETFHGFLGFDMLEDSRRAMTAIANWVGQWCES